MLVNCLFIFFLYTIITQISKTNQKITPTYLPLNSILYLYLLLLLLLLLYLLGFSIDDNRHHHHHHQHQPVPSFHILTTIFFYY